MIGTANKYPFDRILGFILIGLLVIPASAAWSEEFRRWYFQTFNVKQNPTVVRLTYALFITLVAIAGVYILYYFTDLFSLT
jgi:hypothetical protein